MSQQKPPLIIKLVQVLAQQFLTAKLTGITAGVFDVNGQAHLGEISQWHRHANPAFKMNMLGHTTVVIHLSERYTQTKCALITR